jgi:hypothetical protein
MDQLLLQPVRRFGIDQRLRPAFSQADGSRMEVAQMPASCRRRLPSGEGLRNGEPGPGQRAAILGHVLSRQPDGAPPAGALGSCMHTLIRAKK